MLSLGIYSTVQAGKGPHRATAIATSRRFPADFGNTSRTYLDYRMCKFLTWWQVDRVADLSINVHFYLTVIRALFNINNQSTLSVISLWLSEALLPWAPRFSFHVFSSEGCFRALQESPEKMSATAAKTRDLDFRYNPIECPI